MTDPVEAPGDQDQRDRIRDELHTTLFVEAGAGSGKTSALVGRVVSLVTTGTAELRNVAAITFTEKAAAELRDRVRERLERTSAEVGAGGGGADATIAERCRLAIDQLDGAAIGTLHAFAQRVLAENPIEAGLPPRVEIQDEVSSEVEFERRWANFQDHLLADPDLERTLLLLFAAEVKPTALRYLALEFDRNWDLVQDRVPSDAPDPPPLRSLVDGALETVDDACAAATQCRDDTDKLVVRLGEIADHARHLRTIDDELDLLDELSGNGSLPMPKFGGRIGVKGNWDCDVADVRAKVAEAGAALDKVRADTATACIHRVASVIREFTLEAARHRQRAGELAFHDLLVLSRALVRHPEHGAAVRQRLHTRYQRLLLDEFQDTDPIQIELAVRIAADDPASDAAGTLPWDQVDVTPGQLFVVGDPKQSIYRFRRADIAVFIEARNHFGADGRLATLSTNFRSGAPVIDCVNRAFGRLMAEGAAVDVPVPSQPEYVALHAHRRVPPPVGPAVSVIAREAWAEATAGELRANEAAEVAATVARAAALGWSVGTGDGGWRPARLGDITVLVPARTSLPFLEDALDDAGIAYRAESSSLVYVSRAVRDLLMVVRAIDDPTDHLAVVSALRSALFACGDDDLFTFKVSQRGHWNYLALQPDTVEDGPVAAGLAYLLARHQERHWRTPAELLDQVARDRRLFELGFAEGRTRDVWRRLRFVIDQAREWSDATNGGLREYLAWVTRQAGEGARVAEAVLPESDDDAVRIMTIHAAKGLEFPITIVSGMSTKPGGAWAPVQAVFPPTGNVGYKFGRAIVTEEFEAYKPIDEQMGFHERIRLLYVACTRAEDHLVLSLQRKDRARPASSSAAQTNAELLVNGLGDHLAELEDAVDAEVRPQAVPTVSPLDAPPPFDEWAAELRAALRAGARPTTVAATALTADGAPDAADAEVDRATRAATGHGTTLLAGEPPHDEPIEPEPGVAGLAKRPPDLDLPPWLKGRYGTAVGRAVHATLQTIDLATGDGLDAAVAAQCEAEAIGDRTADVAGLVRAALGAPTVRAAAQCPYWREIYACTPVGDGRLLEGYIDLLYRTVDGLVVVDYKTAATAEPAELERRVEGYRLQGASYALTVARTTGEVVARVCFLFLTPDGAVEIDLAGVAGAVADVESLVARGAETVLT
ncbi:MAG: UvrD-helicase domain-containing protein [Acidimicrobiales bacterium]